MRLQALLLCAALPAAACPLSAPQMQQPGVQAQWAVDGEPIVVGRHFALEVQVCPPGAVLERVDATMPEHRHGMNYRPSVKPLGAGRWRVEGLMFHMPGRWDLQMDVRLTDGTRRLRDTLTLP
jgi:hypothetical protein